LTLFERYPTIAIRIEDTPGLNAFQGHPNVFDLRVGPGGVLLFKFFDASFATVRELGRAAETSAPAAWAANDRALAESRRLLGKDGLNTNLVLLSQTARFEIVSPQGVVEKKVQCFVQDPSARLHGISIEGRSPAVLISVVDSISAALADWFLGNGAGRVVDVKRTGKAFLLLFQAPSERPFDPGVSVMTLLLSQRGVSTFKFHVPPL
jgi:hypothetical protein